VEKQSGKLGLACVRVNAIEAKDLPVGFDDYVTPGIAAIWMSHQSAMSQFLQTGDEFGLILEDDFLINRDFQIHLDKLVGFDEFDFLQLGYLNSTIFEFSRIKVANVRDLVFKFLFKVTNRSKLRSLSMARKFFVLEQRGIPFCLVQSDIRAGAHAYVISRDFASAALKMNIPIFVSADAYFIALGGMRTFKMLRSRVNLVRQSSSPSSIQTRFKSEVI
jgi:GR25 family glycosyltransferase involved in LPS biosynthesis